MLGKKVGIDPGSIRTRLLVRGEGTALVEPSVAATTPDGRRSLGVGRAALLAAEGGAARLRSPLRAGAIADPVAVELLLQHMLVRAVGRQRIFKPDVMLAVPTAMGGNDRRAIMDVIVRCGARTTYLIDAPLAGAIGAGLPVRGATAQLVVDLGGGTIELAVISLEGTIVRRVLEWGGAQLTAAIGAGVAAESGIDLDDAAIEEVKAELASAVPLLEERTLRVSGRDRSGEIAEVVVSSTLVAEALAPSLSTLSATLRDALAETPGRMFEDLRARSGVTLVGAMARLRGLGRLVTQATGLRANIPGEPDMCAVRGTAAALDNLDLVKRGLLYIR